MRKILLYLLIFTFSLILTGCDSDVDSGVSIGPYGGGGVFFFFSADKSLLTVEDILLVKDMKNFARKNGYNVSDYDTGGRIGFKADKHIDDIKKTDIIGLPDRVTKEGLRFITVKESSSGNDYQLNATADLTNLDNVKTVKSDASSSVKVNFKLNLPVQVKYTNAERISNNGRTMEWNLHPGEKNLIRADFKL